MSQVRRVLSILKGWNTTPGQSSSPPARPRQLMLELVNGERSRVGSSPVVLSDNPATQSHADACHAMGAGSHWDLEGLKPYMRYSLAGGFHNNGENWYQHFRVGPAGPRDIAGTIRLAMQSWMGSPGHRSTILDPGYRKLSVGLCWSAGQFTAIQHFEGDYLELEQYPAIREGVLEVSGKVKNGVSLSAPDDLIPELWFDPPPVALTVRQLLEVNGYDNGTPVARLRRALPKGYFWQQDDLSVQFLRARSPEQIPANYAVPRSFQEYKAIVDRAYRGNLEIEHLEIDLPLIDALEWSVDTTGFSVRADIGPVIDLWGEGVYSLHLHSPMKSMQGYVTFAQYSMFIE